MKWCLAHRFDAEATALADRHYSRQKIGTPQFVPPGRCIVLVTTCARAVWVTSWPFEEFTRHEWAGAWVCSIFRNEGAGLSSELVRDAVSITRNFWSPPSTGIVTFVDRKKVRPKADPGYCFMRAGFSRVGITKRFRLIALQMLPEDMPEAKQPSIRPADTLPLFKALA